MNIFRQHREKVEAQQAATHAADNGQADMAGTASIYEQMMAQLAAHKSELSKIESVKFKAVKKGEFLPIYAAYVDGILAADETVQDDVVVTIMVWALDAGQFELALRIAEWALKHDLAPPPNFTRSIAAIVTEEIADIAIANKDDAQSYLDDLTDVMEMVTDKDMPDQVKAKLYKALGFANNNEHPNVALECFKKAITLNPRAGVKRDIENLERRLKISNPEPVPPTKEVEVKPKTPIDGGADGTVQTTDAANATDVKDAPKDERK